MKTFLIAAALLLAGCASAVPVKTTHPILICVAVAPRISMCMDEGDPRIQQQLEPKDEPLQQPKPQSVPLKPDA